MAENQLDIKKAFDAIARIIGEREQVAIAVKSIRTRGENGREKTGDSANRRPGQL